VNLEVGSGSHAVQTAAMLKGLEEVMLAHKPDWVMVYGDTNSTLAGALAASKLSIPVSHVEAGLRSFNREMPEEINRVVTDHLAALLLCPSETAVANLATEGISANVAVVGDVMLDVLDWARERLRQGGPGPLAALGLKAGEYLLVTLHRSENTDRPSRLRGILHALELIPRPIVLPLHPRARKAIAAAGLLLPRHVRVIEPVGYLDMLALTSRARLVLTDSGGLQKEAYWLSVPCLTLRDETEWVETVAAGWNRLVGADSERILDGVRTFAPPAAHPPLYGEGRAASRCVALLSGSASAVRPGAPAGDSVPRAVSLS
jgi:UDP-N-acetylglucosamine 2-epimerase